MPASREAFEQFAELVRQQAQKQNEAITALQAEIVALRGEGGNPTSPTLAVLESKMDRILEEVVPLVSQDHDELIRIKASFSQWKWINGITQMIGHAAGVIFGVANEP